MFTFFPVASFSSEMWFDSAMSQRIEPGSLGTFSAYCTGWLWGSNEIHMKGLIEVKGIPGYLQVKEAS